MLIRPINYRNDVFVLTIISLAAEAVSTFIVKIHYLTLYALNMRLFVGYKSNYYGGWTSMMLNKRLLILHAKTAILPMSTFLSCIVITH